MVIPQLKYAASCSLVYPVISNSTNLSLVISVFIYFSVSGDEPYSPYGIVVERSPCHRIYDLGASLLIVAPILFSCYHARRFQPRCCHIVYAIFQQLEEFILGRMPYLDCESQPSIHIGRIA